MRQTLVFYTLLFTILLLPSHYRADASSLMLLGEADLTLYFFDIYHAKLFGEKKMASLEQKLELELTYQRDFLGKRIAEQSAKELESIGTPRDSVARWLPLMESIFPDVKEGDQIRAIYTPGQGIRFVFNGSKVLAEVMDPNFARSFMGIWLSPQTSQPEMRLKLFGLN